MAEHDRWDDSKYEIMDIIETIEKNKEVQIPIECPICNTGNAHIYMYRWENGRGTVWTWCSNCKSCLHASRVKLPNWWENADFINTSELTSHPVFLDLKADMIDKHLMTLLKKVNLNANCE